MTDEGWQRILRIMDEAYRQHLTGLVVLPKRVVADLKRKLSDKQVLDRSDQEQSAPRERPAAAAWSSPEKWTPR